MRNSSRSYGIIFLLLSALLFSSCGRQANEDSASPRVTTADEASVPETASSDIIPRSESLQALVTFLTGEVVLSGSEGDRELEIGDFINIGDELKTGTDGYVELQFGNLGVLRIQSDSLYRLDTADLKEDSEQVSGSLGVGSIVAKIRHLTNRDGFEINVPGAVCAVRGTEFLIRAEEGGAVTIAVADGAVSVSPPSLSELGRDTDISGNNLSDIRLLMPLVTADKEIVISLDTLADVEQILTDYQESEDRNAETDNSKLTELKSRIIGIVTKVPLPSPVAIETVNADILDSETPEILEVEYKQEGDESSYLPALVTLTVTADPRGTRIFINNRPAGQGAASMVLTKGSEVSILGVSPDGRRLEKVLTAGSESQVSLDFEELPMPTESNEDTESGVTSVDVPVSAALPAAVTQSVVSTVTVSPVADKVVFQITSEPADAAVFINGSRLGSGSGEYEGNKGEQLLLKVERPGYENFTQTVSLSAQSPPLHVTLEPRPILRKSRINAAPAVGSLVSNGTIAVGATGGGTVFAVNRNGRILWTRTTRNRDAENITPVISGNRVFLIGNAELAIINISDGSIIARRELTGDQADLFGRRVLIWNKYIILPSDSALIYINPNNVPEAGKVVDSINIPGGSRMTPALWDNQIILADQRGALLYIDPVSKSVTRSVSTASSQPIGQAPAISGNTAVFSGRRGNVTAINLQQGEVIWDRRLKEGGSVRVHTDAVFSNNGVFLYGDGVLYALNLGNGENLFPPVSAVTAPPQIINGVLYLCRDDGTISLLNPDSGAPIGEFQLGEFSRVRPVGLGPLIIAAGEENVYVLDPRSMTD